MFILFLSLILDIKIVSKEHKKRVNTPIFNF